MKRPKEIVNSNLLRHIFDLARCHCNMFIEWNLPLSQRPTRASSLKQCMCLRIIKQLPIHIPCHPGDIH